MNAEHQATIEQRAKSLAENVLSQVADQRLTAGRQCGECQRCCTDLPIISSTVNSAARERCQHQCDGGCAIYERRPKPCRQFSCSWLDGFGRPEDRPDKSGALLETMTADGIVILILVNEWKVDETILDAWIRPGVTAIAFGEQQMLVSAVNEHDMKIVKHAAMQILAGRTVLIQGGERVDPETLFQNRGSE